MASGPPPPPPPPPAPLVVAEERTLENPGTVEDLHKKTKGTATHFISFFPFVLTINLL